jgi:SWI/SNF-related matrix-associated actin-dependent regulator 1 of chromatin subfamily A
MNLYPFQREGVDWLKIQLAATGRALLADEMGLGKTVQALNISSEAEKTLIICPAFLKLNWRDEIHRRGFTRVWLQIVDSAKQAPVADWVIVSFELAAAMHDKLSARRWGQIIIDEAHYLKSPAAIRTQRILGARKIKGIYREGQSKLLCLSGTPAPNGAHELYTMAARCGDLPDGLKSYAAWVQRFCYDTKPSINKFNQFGFAPKGVRNEKELKAILSKFMLRRLKKDVLPELPEKNYQILHIGPDARLKKLIKEEQGYSIEDVMQAMPAENFSLDLQDLLERGPFDLTPLARLRHEFGLAKVPHALSIIKNDLESIEKIGVFCWHRAVAEELNTALAEYNPALVHGGVPHKIRQERVQAFQNESSCRVFIGQIKASGVGITLTSASHALFVEPWYVPGDIDQAVDRFHRIGQKSAVLARFLIVENSLDEEIIKTALRKVETLDRIYG